MRGYSVEKVLGGKPSLADELRLETVKVAAMISLLLEGVWSATRTKSVFLNQGSLEACSKNLRKLMSP